LNDHYYNDDPDSPFWEFQLKGIVINQSLESIDITKSPFFGIDPNQYSVFIKNVPLPLSRADVVNHLNKLDGYAGLTLSEPNKL
jgi:hypothetical protein